jgi:hypothetical protein
MSFVAGDQVPDVRDLVAEVPLTLQNNHYSVSDSVPYLANVVNVACIHCRPPMKLSPEMETFLSRGKANVSNINISIMIALCVWGFVSFILFTINIRSGPGGGVGWGGRVYNVATYKSQSWPFP